MLKCTLNSAPWLIRTKTLNFEGDELTVVDCIYPEMFTVGVNDSCENSFKKFTHLHLALVGMWVRF